MKLLYKNGNYNNGDLTIVGQVANGINNIERLALGDVSQEVVNNRYERIRNKKGTC